MLSYLRGHLPRHLPRELRVLSMPSMSEEMSRWVEQSEQEGE